MKIYHVLFGVMILTTIGLIFTSWGEGGFLHDMRYLSNGSDSYNSNINLSEFSGLDRRKQTEAISGDLDANSTNESTNLKLDSEQRAIGSLISIGKDLLGAFPAAYTLILNLSRKLLIPDIIVNLAIGILSIWMIIKAVAWVFGR